MVMKKASPFVKSIIRLISGSSIAQLITILGSLVITRIYTPDQLGIYSLLLTFISIFGPVISAKYDAAIVLASNEDEAVDLIWGSLIVAFVLGGIFTVIYIIYLQYNPQIYEEINGWSYLTILMLITQAIINILDNYNNRHQEYKLISSVYVRRTLFQNVGFITLGLFKFETIGLVISQQIGMFFGLKKQSKFILSQKKNYYARSWIRIKNVLIKYKKQLFYAFPAHFINSLSYSLLNFFITGLFGLAIFGYYSMTFRILALPLSLVSINVSKVFFRSASKRFESKLSFNKLITQVTILLAFVSIPMVIVLMLFSPMLFEFFFGPGWSVAGKFAQILAPMYGIRLIVSAVSPTLMVVGQQKLEVFMQALFIISSLVSYFICYIFGQSIEAFLTYVSISYSIVYIVFYIVIYKLSKNRRMNNYNA